MVSQAAGLPGMPSLTQASKAAAYASCTHSPARSRSRATRTVAASTRAHSRRCASAIAASTAATSVTSSSAPLLPLHEAAVNRPDLDTAAVGDHGVEAGNGQGRIEVRRLDHVETGDDLLGIHERAIGDGVAANRCRHVLGRQSVRDDHRTALDELVRVPVGGLGVLRRRVRGVGGVVGVDQDRVLSHDSFPSTSIVWSVHFYVGRTKRNRQVCSKIIDADLVREPSGGQLDPMMPSLIRLVTKSGRLFPESDNRGYPGGTSGIRERVQARNVRLTSSPA